MISFASRRALMLGMFTLLAIVILSVDRVMRVSLRDTSTYSGWGLLLVVITLALYNVRKKLPFIAVLSSSAAWLQFHIYLGLLSIVIFTLHMEFRIPSGVFEVALAALFVAVAGSGVIGLLLSRYLARRLTNIGEEVLYERIPSIRRQLADHVEDLVVECVAQNGSTVIAECHARLLKPFFTGPKNFWAHMTHSNRPQRTLLAELDAVERYTNESELATLRELAEYVRLKDTLDCHYALQSVLKLWPFVHIPLTYGLIILAIMHGMVAQAYVGGG